MRRARSSLAKCLGMVSAFLCAHAHAGTKDAELRPTHVVNEGDTVDHELGMLAGELDRILREASADLGLRTALPPQAANTHGAPIKRQDHWLVYGELDRTRRGIRLTLHAVPPESKVLLSREEWVTASDLEMNAVTMLRDLVSTQAPHTGPAASTPPEALADEPDEQPPRSEGRAILALNTAALGGYLGFATQRASASSDARLQYPLIALGAGLGLGASMLVADEWDITSGCAWFLSAGMLWPGASGFLLAEAYGDDPNNRYLYGLAGAMVGLSLATTTVSLTPIEPGQAALAHAGGVFGTLLGGLTEGAILAELTEAPARGMGFGAGAGAIVAGAISTQLTPSATRVLFVDLSASLGALVGAAAGTPLLFVGDEVSDGRSRAWFISVLSGTLLGGAAGLWMTRNEDAELASSDTGWFGETVRPYAGIVGHSALHRGRVSPVFGVGLSGSW